jgi:hypothetical protein
MTKSETVNSFLGKLIELSSFFGCNGCRSSTPYFINAMTVDIAVIFAQEYNHVYMLEKIFGTADARR